MTAPQPTPTPPSPDGAASSTPPSGPPANAEPWRVPADDPRPWARGKTAEELLNISGQMYGALSQLVQQPTQPSYQPPSPQPSFDPNQIKDDDVITGREMRGYVSQLAAPVQQGFNQVYSSIARSNVDTVRSRNKDVFDRYGPEVESWIARVPPEGRTLDNLETIVNVVRANHVRELATDIAREMVASGDPTLRSGGAYNGHPTGSHPGSLGRLTESEELPADYRQFLKDKGITDETVREFCASQNISPMEWYATAKKHKMSVITERSKRGG